MNLKPLDDRIVVRPNEAETQTASASPRAWGSSFWKTLRRVVFERGSNRAQRRRPSYFRRSPVIASRIAVG